MSKAAAEALRFLVVGSTTVAIDWIFYQLTMSLGLPIGVAKAIGFISGTIFAFIVNRQWTFAVGGRGSIGELGRFCGVYGGTLVVNVAVNAGVLVLLGLDRMALVVAFVVATGVSATLNFLGMKFFVFRPTSA